MAILNLKNNASVGLLVLSLATMCAALTGGQMQPEYLAFEQAENANLVNLPTGNLVYTIPFGSVASPSGVGYPVILTYHAGIMNDQEATWTGLGWGLNEGSINRMVRGFPDDYNGEPSLTHTHALGGGDDNFIGMSFSGSYGHYGAAASISFHWANWGDHQAFGFWGASMGISVYGVSLSGSMDIQRNASISLSGYGFRGGYKFGGDDPHWYASYSFNFGVAGLTISSDSDPRWSVAGVSFNSYSATKNNTNISTTGYSIDGSWIGIPLSYSSYTTNWVFDEMKTGNAVGYLYQSPYTPNDVVTENTLLAEVMKNQQNSSAWNYVLSGGTGTTPTLKKKSKNDRLEYSSAGDYAMPAQDIYMVNGQGLDGAFKPINYKAMVAAYASEENSQWNGLVGKPKANPLPGEDPFEYYFNPNPINISPKFNEGIVFKMIGEAALNLVDDGNGASYPGSTDFSNIDAPGGLPGKTRGTRIEPIFGLDPNFKDKLTGFVVTTQNGNSYYYTQPLFSLQNISLVNNRPVVPTNINNCGSHTCQGGTDCECSYQQDFGAYAPTWLLTSVTGPDYIKKVWINPASNDYYEGDQDIANENLHPHQGDYGYWVSFRYEYGAPVHLDKNGVPYLAANEGTYQVATYPWQSPYMDWYRDPCSQRYFTSFGLKEITYLKSIETASEVAYFRTSERLDGIGLDFDKDYPKFQNESSLQEENTSSGRLVTPANEKCGISQVCTRSRVCKLPSVIPLTSSMTANSSTLDNCYTITVYDPAFYGLFDWDEMQAGTTLASLTFSADVHYKSSCFQSPYTRENQQAVMTVIKDDQGWTINKNTRIITAKQDQVGTNIVSSVSTNSLDKADPLLAGFPHSLCQNQCGSVSYQTPFGRCIYGEKTTDGSNKPCVVFYILGYDGIYSFQGNSQVRTGLRFGEWHFQQNWGWWDPDSYGMPKFSSGQVSTSIRDRYRNRNTIIPFMKKLDEIAWYSKTQFPFINGNTDPGAAQAKQYFPWPDLPYPQSYHRVKFRYNYELAHGTPNSVDINEVVRYRYAEGGGGAGRMGQTLVPKYPYRVGGRLTLKEVREEAGPEDASVAMPPYLFEYQVKDAAGTDYNYTRFADADAWGFRTASTGPDPTSKTAGVNWNLKKVLLPSCASMEFNYERDFINSVFGTLYRMSMSKGNSCPGISIIPYEEAQGQNYLTKTISSVSSNDITVDNADGLSVGMYFFIHAEKQTPSSYSFEYNGTNYTCSGTDNTYHYAKYWYKIAAISGNIISANLIVDLSDFPVPPVPGTDNITMIALKPELAWCGDIRATSTIFRTFNAKTEMRYDYSGASGVVEILPSQCVPSSFIKAIVSDVSQNTAFLNNPPMSCNDVVVYGASVTKSIIAWNPFSTDMGENYNTGNTTVMYPQVATYAVNRHNPPQKIAGSTVYQFYSINDIVNGKPLIEVFYPAGGDVNDFNVKVKRIIDRTGLVGIPKKIQLLDINNNVVFEGGNEFTFSEELSAAGDFSKPGTYYNALNDRLPAGKALGLIQERTIRRETTDGVNFPYASVTDVIISRPYVSKIMSKKYDVVSETKCGLFDAQTGSASVTVTQNTTGSNVVENKTDVQVPYYLLLDTYNTQQAADLQALRSKNFYSLAGSGFVAKSSTFAVPDNIQTIISESNGNTGRFEIKDAGGETWHKIVEPSGVVPFAQARFYMGENFKWKGGTFQWPTYDAANWLQLSSIVSVDQYSRPRTRIDAAGTPHSVMYHPYLNGIVGAVDKGQYDECAVFTCDYDDDRLLYTKDGSGVHHIEDGYFDFANGWEKGIGNVSGTGYTVRLSTQDRHFGKKCVYVENSYGPTKNCKIIAGKDYVFSAWVKVTDGNLKLVAEYRTGDANGNLNPPSDFAVATIPASAAQWQYAEVKVPASSLTGTNWYIRMWVGNDAQPVQAYIDDIRFRPEGSMVSSIYYDENLGVPIATVDANNKGMYYKFDTFGRLIERGAIKDNP